MGRQRHVFAQGQGQVYSIDKELGADGQFFLAREDDLAAGR